MLATPKCFKRAMQEFREIPFLPGPFLRLAVPGS